MIGRRNGDPRFGGVCGSGRYPRRLVAINSLLLHEQERNRIQNEADNSRKKFTAKLKAFNEWLKKARTMKTKDLWETAKAKLRGHYNYYGVTDNTRGIERLGQEVRVLLHKWLNRRGKRQCLNWERFDEMLKRFPLPIPGIKVRMF